MHASRPDTVLCCVVRIGSRVGCAVTCAEECSGPESYASCLPPTGCTAGACVGDCLCLPSTSTHYASNCSAIDGVCAPACLGGSKCTDQSVCTNACPNTVTEHFVPGCQARDGNCAGCVGGSMCDTGNVCSGGCPATPTAHYNAACELQDGACTAGLCIGGSLCTAASVCAGCIDTATTHYATNCSIADGMCAPACPFGLCTANSQCLCPATNTTAWFSADCRTSGMCRVVSCCGGGFGRFCLCQRFGCLFDGCGVL